MPKLIVNYGEYESSKFDQAVSYLENEHGYAGEAWDMVVASGDFQVLVSFLSDDGVDAELE